ncbi:MAG: hypothetical protein ABS938_05430 [Psychrobacillus psychrodurans]
MKHIAEQVATSDKPISENEKHRLNEMFMQLMGEVTILEDQLRIFDN